MDRCDSYSIRQGEQYVQKKESFPDLHTPPFALDRKTWGVNGFFVADGDVLSAGMALAQAIKLAYANGSEWENLRRNAKLTAEAYSLAKREESVKKIWAAF